MAINWALENALRAEVGLPQVSPEPEAAQATPGASATSPIKIDGAGNKTITPLRVADTTSQTQSTYWRDKLLLEAQQAYTNNFRNTLSHKWADHYHGQAVEQEKKRENGLNAGINAVNSAVDEYNAAYHAYSNLENANKKISAEEPGVAALLGGRSEIALSEAQKALDDAKKKLDEYGITVNNGVADLSWYNDAFYNNLKGYAKQREATSEYIPQNGLFSHSTSFDIAEDLSLISDDEMQLYNYLVERDSQYTQGYKQYLLNLVEQRKGQARAEEIQGMYNGPEKAVARGLEAYKSGLSGSYNAVVASLSGDPMKTSASQYAAQDLRADLTSKGDEWWRTAGFDMMQSAGGMTPGIIAGMLNPTAGTVVFGATSAASAYQEKLAEGWSKEDASSYGVLVGTAEAALGKVLGGIPAFTGKDAGIFTALTDNINNAIARAIAKTAGRMASEGLEEGLQTYIAPAIEAAVRGTPYDNPGLKNALYSAVLGAMTSAAMGGGQFASDLSKGNVSPNRIKAAYEKLNAGGEEVRNIIDEALRISPVTEEAVKSPVKTQELAGEQVTPDTTQEAEQVASERLNQQASAEAHVKVLNALQSGRINNTTAKEIANNPELLAAFKQIMPNAEISDEMNSAERQRIIQRGAREFVRAQAQSQSAVESSFDPLAMLGLDEMVNSEQSAKASPEQEAQRAVDESVSALREHSDTEVDKENAAWAHDGGLETYMLVRDIVNRGASYSEANKILSNPEMKSAFEDMFGKLPENRGKAKQAIVDARIKPKAVGDDAFDASAMLYPELATDISAEVDAKKNARVPAGNLVIADPSNMVSPEARERGISVTPDEAEVKAGVADEIGPEGKVEAPANRANAKAATSRPKGKVDWRLMDEMSAAKKEAAKNEVSSKTQTDKTSESKVYDASLSAEENEAVNANMASDVGKGASDFEAELRENHNNVVKKNSFGSHTETASKATKNIVDRIKTHLGESENATEEQKIDGFAVPDGDREALTSIASNAEALANGEQTISQFIDSYKRLKDKNDFAGKRFYFAEVQEKLESADSYLRRKNPDVERGTRAASEAMQLLDKRINDRLNADESIREEMRDMPHLVSDIKDSSLYKTLLKTGDGETGRKTRFTLDLLSPNNFLKMFDGFNAEGKGHCYKLANKERACNIKNKTIFAKANSFFNELLANKNAEALLSGKMTSGVYFNGVEKLSATELIHLVRGLESIKASRGEDGLNTIKGIGLSRKGNVEVLRFDYNGNKTPVVEQLDELRAELDILLADNATAKAYDDALTRMLEYMHPELNNAHIATNGYDMGYIGDSKYFPVRYTSENPSKRRTDIDNFFDGLGVTKERVKEEGGIVKVDAGMEGINQYMRSASQYAAWAEYSNEVQMLMKPDANGTTLADVVQENLGVGASGLLENYANDLKFSTENKAPTAVETALSILRKNLGQAAITLKFTTPIKQAAGTLAAAGDIKIQYLLAAQFGAGKQYSDTDNWLLQHRRLGGIDPTIGNINNVSDTWWKKAVSKVKVGDVKVGEWALTAVSRADSKAILNIYKAAALQVSSENGGVDITKSPDLQKEVDELFANALLGSQSDMTAISNSALFRSDSEFKKNLTLFKAQQNAQLNSTISAILEARAAKGTKNADVAAKKAGRVVAGQIASSFEFALLGAFVKLALHKFKDVTDEEDELSIESIAKSLGDDFLETLSSVYLFGDSFYGAIKTGINIFSEKGTSTLYDPSIGGLNTVLDIINKLNNVDKNPSAKTVKDLALSVSNLFGVPLAGVYDAMNAGALWVRDASRARSGKNNDTFKNSDILNVAKDVIEWSKATDEQKRIWEALGIKNVYAGNSYKNAPSGIEYDDVDYDLSKKERKEFQKTALEVSQGVIEELVNSSIYKEATDENKAAMMRDAVSYGKDAAKKQYFEGNGVEYESDWDDERVLKDLPGYLAFKTASKVAYGDKDETPDYDTIDALIKSSYGDLSDEAKALIDKNSRFAKMDDLYDASKLGIDSETWYTDYKATYDELAEKVDQSIAEAKAIEEKTGEDAKAEYGWSEAATEFAHYVEAHAETPKQAELLRSQFTYWQQIPGSTESYDNYRTAGISIDSSLHLVSKLGELKPLDGNKTVVQRQKQEAVAFDEVLTDEEKYIALLEVTNSNSTKKLSNIQYAQSKGMSPEECFRQYLAD